MLGGLGGFGVLSFEGGGGGGGLFLGCFGGVWVGGGGVGGFGIFWGFGFGVLGGPQFYRGFHFRIPRSTQSPKPQLLLSCGCIKYRNLKKRSE